MNHNEQQLLAQIVLELKRIADALESTPEVYLTIDEMRKKNLIWEHNSK